MSELPKGWAVASFADLGTWGAGGTPKAGNPHFYGGDIPFAKIGDLNDGEVATTEVTITQDGLASSSAKLVPTNSLLIAMYGSIGKLGINAVPVATNQAIAFLVPDSRLTSSTFLYWALRSKRLDLIALGQGGTQQNISQTILHAQHLHLPPIREQLRIVAKIDGLNGKSRRARNHLDHIPRLVEKYKQAVLAAAFRGDLTREWRSQQQLLAQWQKANPVDHFAWSSGKNLPTKEQNGGSVPVIGGNGVNGYHDQALIEFPTLVIGRVGAQCGNVHLSSGPAWITDNAIYAKYISDHIDLSFAALFFRHADLNSLAGGSGQPYVNQSTLNALPLYIPTLAEQREIVARVEQMIGLIDHLASEASKANRLIDSLDDSVLAKAFRGELVPQDPTDEPASVLLGRIKAERSAVPKERRGRRPRASE